MDLFNYADFSTTPSFMLLSAYVVILLTEAKVKCIFFFDQYKYSKEDLVASHISCLFVWREESEILSAISW